MCGIVAQFSKSISPPDKKMIKLMADDIHHRGPDDTGYHFGAWYGLGFKRLSIIDFSKAAHQPMFDENERFLITYNGELYNYIELRRLLKSHGHIFFSDSDTEVVLKSFMHWGPDCLYKFNGMFAFIIISLPDETIENVDKTIALIRKVSLYIHTSGMQFTRILPDAALHDIAKKRGILPADFNWFKPYKVDNIGEIANPSVHDTLPKYVENLTYEEIKRKIEEFNYMISYKLSNLGVIRRVFRNNLRMEVVKNLSIKDARRKILKAIYMFIGSIKNIDKDSNYQ